MTKEFLIEEILTQPNTLTGTLIEKLEEMLSLLEPRFLEELHFALFCDVFDCNKIKNGMMNMQYVHHCYAKIMRRQIEALVQESFSAWQKGAPLKHGDPQEIAKMKQDPLFDANDVYDWLFCVISKKMGVWL